MTRAILSNPVQPNLPLLISHIKSVQDEAQQVHCSFLLNIS